jgi:hypothetical protein
VYDLSDELLFHRFLVSRRGGVRGFADVAAHPAVGAPLMAASTGLDWNEKALLAQAAKAARKRLRNVQWDSARFVAYSFPNVGVQFLAGRKEVLLLELVTCREGYRPGWPLAHALCERRLRLRRASGAQRARGRGHTNRVARIK